MPNLSSPLGATSSSMPLVSAAAIGQLAGVPIVFATMAALTAAITAERANIAGLGAVWSDKQPVGVASEVASGVMRSWNSSAQHSRTAVLGVGVTAVLAGDSNQVLFGAGTPAAGTGLVGDVVVDGAAGVFYTKTGAATWGNPAAMAGNTPAVFANGSYDTNVPPRLVSYTLNGVAHTVAYPTATTFVVTNPSGSRTGTQNASSLVVGIA